MIYQPYQATLKVTGGWHWCVNSSFIDPYYRLTDFEQAIERLGDDLDTAQTRLELLQNGEINEADHEYGGAAWKLVGLDEISVERFIESTRDDLRLYRLALTEALEDIAALEQGIDLDLEIMLRIERYAQRKFGVRDLDPTIVKNWWL